MRGWRMICFMIAIALTALLAPAAGLAGALVSGPMVGYSTMREVAVWVQTDTEARVTLRYRPKGTAESFVDSRTVRTSDKSFHTAHLIADRVEPGIVYEYRVLVDGQPQARAYPLEFRTQPLWQWRGDPPGFRFALGSCAYVNETRYDRPGTPYGSDYQIFGHILARQPAFMLWMGDNVYLREADWNARGGIYRRYGHTRALPELQPLLGSVHHYATWDDHDYGPNDSDRSYWLKDVTLEAFKDFWANPNYGAGGGVAGTFQWNDAQFFLLDNRWNRSPNDRSSGEAQLFGPDQVRWLIDSLAFSQATFKFVVSGGVFLFDGRDGESAIKLAPQERERIIEAITDERIPGVVFLNGDVHHSRLVELARDGAYPLYEWTVSSLTAGSSSPHGDPERTNIVPGSLLLEHNFGLIDISGPRRDRVARLTLVDARGAERWSREIRARDLCHPAECEYGH